MKVQAIGNPLFARLPVGDAADRLHDWTVPLHVPGLAEFLGDG